MTSLKKKKKDSEFKKKSLVNDKNQKLHQVYTEMSTSLNLPPIDVHIKPPGEQSHISKISEAQSMIDNLQFKEASEIYIKTLEGLKTEQNANAKNKAIEELHKLYDKLNLYQNIVYFQESMKKKDLNNLQQHVKNITENYNRLKSRNEGESQLMNLARENHQNYVNFLNSEGYMPKY